MKDSAPETHRWPGAGASDARLRRAGAAKLAALGSAADRAQQEGLLQPVGLRISGSEASATAQSEATRRPPRRLPRGEMQAAAFVRGPGHSNSDDWTAARRRRFQVSNAARPAHAVLQIGVAAAGELGSGHRGSEAQDCGAALLGGRAPDAPSASHSRVGPAAPCHCDPSLKSASSRWQPLVMPPLAH